MKSSDNREEFGNLEFCNIVLVSHLLNLKNQNNFNKCKNEMGDAILPWQSDNKLESKSCHKFL